MANIDRSLIYYREIQEVCGLSLFRITEIGDISNIPTRINPISSEIVLTPNLTTNRRDLQSLIFSEAGRDFVNRLKERSKAPRDKTVLSFGMLSSLTAIDLVVKFRFRNIKLFVNDVNYERYLYDIVAGINVGKDKIESALQKQFLNKNEKRFKKDKVILNETNITYIPITELANENLTFNNEIVDVLLFSVSGVYSTLEDLYSNNIIQVEPEEAIIRSILKVRMRENAVGLITFEDDHYYLGEYIIRLLNKQTKLKTKEHPELGVLYMVYLH